MVSNFQLFSFSFCSIIHVLLKDFPLCSMNMDKLYIHSRNNSPGGTIQIKNKKKHRKINKKKQQQEKSPRARLVPLGNHCRNPHFWEFSSWEGGTHIHTSGDFGLTRFLRICGTKHGPYWGFSGDSLGKLQPNVSLIFLAIDSNFLGQ